MKRNSVPSAHQQVSALIDRLEKTMAEKDTPLRAELIRLIESGRHLLIGAQALIRYTEPRFTADTDYAVGMQMFRRVRKWFKDRQAEIEYEDEGEAIRSPTLAVAVLNAAHNPVLLTVLKAETGLPSPEGLAAYKYVAMVSPARGRTERMQDAVDFSKLVLRPGFDADKLLAYMVGPYAEQRDTIVQLIRDLEEDRPIQI